MKKCKLILMLCLLSTLIFISTTFAATPLILKITVQNNLTSQFVFSSWLSTGNTCTSAGPNSVICSIAQFGGDLIWTNQKTPSCTINIGIWPPTGANSAYSFSLNGTGGGNNVSSGYTYSFPTSWIGTSDFSTELVINGIVSGAQCAN